MRIENLSLRLPGRPAGPWLPHLARGLASQLGDGAFPLRFAIAALDGGEARVEATVVRCAPDERILARLARSEILEARRRQRQARPFAVVQIVPTGIGCEIGGFAGDAAPASNLLAAASDLLVTHPNAVNASELNELAANVLYVEGRSLDDFLLGHLALDPVAANRIGSFVDPTGAKHLDMVIHALHAALAVKGVDCETYTVLDQEMGVEIAWSESGCAVGTLRNPETLVEGVERLLASGCDAVGGVSVIHGVTGEMFARHQRGETPNPSGGVEAIITHLISKLFRVPTAHAPLPYYQDLKRPDTANPRAAAEFLSAPHYFCVLKGLHRAPRLRVLESLEASRPGWITLENVGAVVAPAGALGGIPALAAEWNGIPLIAVRENTSVLRVGNDRLGMPNVIEVESYLEAAGLLLALREGIAPAALRRPLGTARRI
ncbi:MAG TPA: DUF3326 domain-containing protein [Myxococcota bacterium]